MQCHSVLGVRTEGFVQLANLRDLIESSKHVSSPCWLSQVCTLLPSVCLIGGNHLFPPTPSTVPGFPCYCSFFSCSASIRPFLVSSHRRARPAVRGASPLTASSASLFFTPASLLASGFLFPYFPRKLHHSLPPRTSQSHRAF